MNHYQPQAGSLPARVCAFFQAHPEEELGVRDIALKFDVDALRVSATLNEAVKRKLLNVRKTSGGNVYSAGPALPGQGEPATRRATGKVDLPAPDAIVIEPGVAMPPTSAAARAAAYAPVFERMRPGDSFTVGEQAAKFIVNAARAWGKARAAKFAARSVDANTTRIWRTE